MDPLTLSTATIAALILTKAVERVGELTGEAGVGLTIHLFQLLQERFPSTAHLMTRAQHEPQCIGQAIIDLEAAAKTDCEVAAAVDALASEGSARLASLTMNCGKIADKIGVSVQGGSVSISQLTV